MFRMSKKDIKKTLLMKRDPRMRKKGCQYCSIALEQKSYLTIPNPSFDYFYFIQPFKGKIKKKYEVQIKYCSVDL